MKRQPHVRSLLLGACMTAFSATALSQVTIQLGGGLGVVSPTGDYSGTTIDHYNGVAYGMSTGYNVHGKARLGLVGFTIVGEVGYSHVSNDGNAEPGQGSVEISHNVVSFKVGPEFQLGVPLAPVSPYVGGNVALHRFSGTTRFQGVSKVPSAEFELASASRIGLGVNGGLFINLSPSMTLDIGVAYNLMNLSGKEWKNVRSGDERLNTYLALNDDKDPQFAAGNDKHVVGSDRSISALQFSATLMFGL